jgi:hypothetical protein
VCRERLRYRGEGSLLRRAVDGGEAVKGFEKRRVSCGATILEILDLW